MGIFKRVLLAGALVVLSAAGLAPTRTGPISAPGPAAAAPAPRGSTRGASGAHGDGYTAISFCDVNANTPHEAAILELAAMGIAGGRPGGSCGS